MKIYKTKKYNSSIHSDITKKKNFVQYVQRPNESGAKKARCTRNVRVIFP